MKPEFTFGMQRMIKSQYLVQATAVVSHATAVKLHSRIAAKNLAADLTHAETASQVRSRAIAEVESRTNVRRCVSPAVIPFVPTRVRIKGVRFSVNRHVIQPDRSRVVSAFHHVENSEA